MKRIYCIMAVALVVCVLGKHSFGQEKPEGKGWANPVKIASTPRGEYGVPEQPAMAIDSKSKLHVVWHASGKYLGGYSEEEIYYSMFDGTRWSQRRNLCKSPGHCSELPAIAIDSKDNVHVVYAEGSGRSSRKDYHLFHMTFDGKTWSRPVKIEGTKVGYSYPPILRVDSNDNLHLVYQEKGNRTGSKDDGLSYSKFDGKKWSKPKTLENGLISAAYMAIDGENACHVIYQRGDSGDKLKAVKHSVSKDFVKWSKPKPLYVKYKRRSGRSFKYQDQGLRYLVTDSEGTLHVVLDHSEHKYTRLPPDPSIIGEPCKIKNLWKGQVYMKWEGEKWTKAERHKSYRNIEKIYKEIISGLSRYALLPATCLSEDKIHRIYQDKDPVRGFSALYHTYKQKPKSRKIKLSPEQLKKVEDLVKNLGDEEYKIRKKATEELIKIAEPAIPALKKAHKGTKDPEVKERIEKILKELE